MVAVLTATECAELQCGSNCCWCESRRQGVASQERGDENGGPAMGRDASREEGQRLPFPALQAASAWEGPGMYVGAPVGASDSVTERDDLQRWRTVAELTDGDRGGGVTQARHWVSRERGGEVVSLSTNTQSTTGSLPGVTTGPAVSVASGENPAAGGHPPTDPQAMVRQLPYILIYWKNKVQVSMKAVHTTNPPRTVRKDSMQSSSLQPRTHCPFSKTRV